MGLLRRQCLILFALGTALLGLAACGYHVGGGADLVPKGVKTISIPAFRTVTTRYKLVDALPQEIGREFTARTRFRVENDPGLADAVLNGTINSVYIYPTASDPGSGRTTGVTVMVSVSVHLIERGSGRVLYERNNWTVRELYAVSGTDHQYFDESGPAFDRVTRDVARQLVSGVVENF